MNEIKTCENVKPMCSEITDDQIIAALTELYTRKAEGDTGYLCIEYDALNNELYVCQYPSSNSWSRVEQDGEVWDCPHVHSIEEWVSASDLLEYVWSYDSDMLYDIKDCDAEILGCIRDPDFDNVSIPYHLIESVREAIEERRPSEVSAQ